MIELITYPGFADWQAVYKVYGKQYIPRDLPSHYLWNLLMQSKVFKNKREIYSSLIETTNATKYAR